jgi:hypothetical protein
MGGGRAPPRTTRAAFRKGVPTKAAKNKNKTKNTGVVFSQKTQEHEEAG